MKIKLSVVIMVPFLILIFAGSSLAGDFICKGTVEGGSNTDYKYIKKNVVVPKGEACKLIWVKVRRNVLVEEGATFGALSVIIKQNFEAKEGSRVGFGSNGKDGNPSKVKQNFKCDKSQRCRICNTHIKQNLDVIEVPEAIVGTYDEDVPGRCVEIDAIDDDFEGVIVYQNAKFDKSSGFFGNMTVEDDLDCSDGNMESLDSVSVGGDNNCF